MNSNQYKKLFLAAEKNLYDHTTLKEKELTAALKEFADREACIVVGNKADNTFFKQLVAVAFYSGFSAEQIGKRKKAIEKYFSNWEVAAGYSEKAVNLMLEDADMLRNPLKIKGCIENAKMFGEILKKHKSISAYLNSFGPFDSDEKLFNLSKVLRKTFSYLGPITVYHFMMDIGLDVLKPDRVICRIFHRLGITDDPKIKKTGQRRDSFLWSVVVRGRLFAAAAQKSIRYIDIVFVANGQEEISTLGLVGICVEEKPKCTICSMRPLCPRVGLRT
jgi:DNA-3-methyladenine glycosylase I